MSRHACRVAAAFLGLACYTTVAVLATLVPVVARPALGQGPSTLDQIKSRGTLRAGWGVWFPYVYRDPQTKDIKGVSIDIFNEMAKALGVRAEFVEDSWATMVAGLQARKFDILNALVITEERKRAADFTKPITRHQNGFLLLKANADKYRAWQDFDKPDRRIVVSMGSSTDVVATRELRQAQILRVRGQDDQVLAVLTGKADAQFSSVDSMLFITREHPQLTIFKVPEFPASEVAFAVPQGDAAFLEWLNRFIDQQRASGNLRRLIEKNGLDASFLVD